MDDLHDDIANFLTRAHCEEDVLTYLGGTSAAMQPVRPAARARDDERRYGARKNFGADNDL